MIPLKDDNPTRLWPLATVAIIVACAVVFLWQVSLGTRGGQLAVLAYGMVPARLFELAELPPQLNLMPPAGTVFTSMFMHAGFMHFAGNMLYLWIFGNNVEDAMGHVKYVVFYLVCGVVAAVGQAVLDPASQIPMIGASGAISGVLGAYLLLYPHARILMLIPIGFYVTTARLPAVLVLGLWFLIQLVNSSLAQGEGGVAWFAHLGGFIAGMILVPFFKDREVALFHPLRRS